MVDTAHISGGESGRYLGSVAGRYQIVVLDNVYATDISYTGRADEGQDPTIITDSTILISSWYQTNMADLLLGDWNLDNDVPIIVMPIIE